MMIEELEKEAEYYAREKYSPNTDPFIIAVADDAFKDGAEFGYNKALEQCADKFAESNRKWQEVLDKANEWHYPSKGEYPKEDCEVVILHENGKKNIQKWENGNWTNAIVIPVIAWKEIIIPELKEIE